MVDTAIIADDLTGACDSGVKSVNFGYETQVVINARICSKINKNECHIFSVNTNTRSVEPEEAYRRVKKVAYDLNKAGINRFYKKIDSVLRGNIGREIDGLFEVLGFDLAIIAPAFPDNGRIIKDGLLYISSLNIPNNANHVSAKEVICSGTSRRCGTVPLSTVRKGTAVIRFEILRLYSEGNSLVLLDAEKNEDLELIAKSINGLKQKVLTVGSAGFINALWRQWGKDEPQNNLKIGTHTTRNDEISQNNILLIVGSRHPATVAQIQHLKIRDDILFYGLQVEDLKRDISVEEATRIAKGMCDDFHSTQNAKCIVITTDSIYNNKVLNNKRILSEDVSHPVIAEGIARISKRLMDFLPITRLITTGGDITNSVLDILSIQQIELISEPITGIGVGRFLPKEDRPPLYFATKSGGFGDASILDRMVDYMYSEQF